MVEAPGGQSMSETCVIAPTAFRVTRADPSRNLYSAWLRNEARTVVSFRQRSPRRLPHVENRTCYRVGGAAARHGFDDRTCHAHGAGVEKRDQWPQQRPRPGEMAKLLARSLGKSSLQLVLARPLGTRSLRVSATLKRREWPIPPGVGCPVRQNHVPLALAGFRIGLAAMVADHRLVLAGGRPGEP